MEKQFFTSSTEKEQNDFWRKQIKFYKKTYSKEIVRCEALGSLMFYWEKQMLIENQCIGKKGILLDGFIVYEENKSGGYSQIYKGFEKDKAIRAKNETKNSVLREIPIIYQSYFDYLERKKQAEQINNI